MHKTWKPKKTNESKERKKERMKDDHTKRRKTKEGIMRQKENKRKEDSESQEVHKKM